MKKLSKKKLQEILFGELGIFEDKLAEQGAKIEALIKLQSDTMGIAKLLAAAHGAEIVINDKFGLQQISNVVAVTGPPQNSPPKPDGKLRNPE